MITQLYERDNFGIDEYFFSGINLPISCDLYTLHLTNIGLVDCSDIRFGPGLGNNKRIIRTSLDSLMIGVYVRREDFSPQLSLRVALEIAEKEMLDFPCELKE